jgi:hypothetical protein
MRVVVVIALAALLLPSLALADGPSYVAEGGLGVLARDGKHRYVAVSTGAGTAIERIAVHGGAVEGWAVLAGSWGVPQPTMSAAHLEGLTRDGKRLVVAAAGMGYPTRFAVIDARDLRIDKRFALPGNFAYDALSPDGRTLYLTQYVNRNDATRYVVRAYDLEHGKLLPGRVADKAQASWVMQGFATTRTRSADGRWVYTLFMRPGGYPFVHALDTVRGVAHCIGLPWTATDQSPLMRMRLTLTNGESKLALDGGSGKRWLSIDTATWKIAHPVSNGFRWTWLAAATTGAVVLMAVLLLGRRRLTHTQKEALPQPL